MAETKKYEMFMAVSDDKPMPAVCYTAGMWRELPGSPDLAVIGVHEKAAEEIFAEVIRAFQGMLRRPQAGVMFRLPFCRGDFELIEVDPSFVREGALFGEVAARPSGDGEPKVLQLVWGEGSVLAYSSPDGTEPLAQPGPTVRLRFD